jgi:hypothetical protein
MDSRERSDGLPGSIDIMKPWITRDGWGNGFIPADKIRKEGFPELFDTSLEIRIKIGPGNFRT